MSCCSLSNEALKNLNGKMNFFSDLLQFAINRLSKVTVILLLSGAFGIPGNANAQNTSSPYQVPEISGTPLQELKIALDVGHSLASVGATSATGRGEYEYNAETTRTIAGILKAAGAEVVIINADGMMKNLYERGPTAGQSGADCFISIHHDSVNNKYLDTWTYQGRELSFSDRFRGYSVFASTKNMAPKSSRTLALNVGKALYETGMRPTLHHNEPIQGENRPLIDKRYGVYEFTDLVVLKTSPMPAILLECGVIVHREEEQLVRKKEYQEMIGKALVVALSESMKSGAISTGDKKGIFSKQKPLFPFFRPKSDSTSTTSTSEQSPEKPEEKKNEPGVLNRLFKD